LKTNCIFFWFIISQCFTLFIYQSNEERINPHWSSYIFTFYIFIFKHFTKNPIRLEISIYLASNISDFIDLPCSILSIMITTSKSTDIQKSTSENNSNNMNPQRYSGRNDWLKKRWRHAIKSVMIGFGRFEESLEEEPDLQSTNVEDGFSYHVFGAVSNGVEVFGANHVLCGRCAKKFKGTY